MVAFPKVSAELRVLARTHLGRHSSHGVGPCDRKFVARFDKHAHALVAEALARKPPEDFAYPACLTDGL